MTKKQVTKQEFKTYRDEKHRYMICQNSISNGKYWNGKLCDVWSKVGEQTTASLCWKCTMSLCASPEVGVSYKPSGRPRGWQFMKEYVDEQGNVFHKGVEQPQLKGTLSATVIDNTDKKKLSKKEKEELRNEILVQISMLRGEVKKATLKKDINNGTRSIRKLERQLKKIK